MQVRSVSSIAFVLVLALACDRGEALEPPAAAAPVTVPVAPVTAPAPPPPPVSRAPVPALPDPLPGRRIDVSASVGAALRVAIGDFDGDGDGEIALVDAERMRVIEPSGRELASAPVARGIQALVAADLDADGRDELFAGWGMTREHLGTRAAVTVHRLHDGSLTEATVLEPRTSRQDVAALVPMPESASLLIAHFESKYQVKSVVAKRAGSDWETTPLASLRMATIWARGDVDGDGEIELVVGRVYGDAVGTDGDAFVLRADGSRTAIPTTRGVRALAVADTDGDGRAEVLLGDGWHQHYAQSAQGLLTWSRFRDGAFHSEAIEDTAGQYGISRILPVSIDGRTAIVAAGDRYVRVFVRAGDGWQGLTIAGAARDVAVGDLDGAPGDEILLVGDRSEIVHLSGDAWPR